MSNSNILLLIIIDHTQAFIKEKQQQYPHIIYRKNKENNGPAKALNLGLTAAKGEFIVPLDDDDFLPPRSLYLRTKHLKANPTLDWSSGYYFVVNEQNTLIESPYTGMPQINMEQDLLQQLLEKNRIVNGSATLRTSRVKAIGGWDKRFKCQDYNMWIRMSHAGYRYGIMEHYVSFYRIHEHQLRTTHSVDGTWEHEQAIFREMYGYKNNF